MSISLISNFSFLPLGAITQDVDLVNPYGLAVIDNSLWAADNGRGVLTHYSSGGVKLAPNRVIPFASSSSAQLSAWVNFIYGNIKGLPLNNSNILIALGLPVTTFVIFRDTIANLVSKKISLISQKSSSAIFRVFLDYKNSAPPLQTVNDIAFATSTFTQIDTQQQSAPPTGLIGNPTSGFIISWVNEITGKTQTAVSYLIAVTNTGVIYGYTPLFNNLGGVAIVAVDRSALGSIFTGLTIANNNLYVVDLNLGGIRVYDSTFVEISGEFDFIDQDQNNPLPSDFVPYNIVSINGLLYVTYGKLNSTGKGVVKGSGNGFISVFNYDGSFVKRLVSQSQLNAPWSIVVAPTGFSIFAGFLLVGNQGDGLINGYDFNGNFLGVLSKKVIPPTPIQTNGLNGLISDGTFVYVSSGFLDQFGFTNGLVSTIAANVVN